MPTPVPRVCAIMRILVTEGFRLMLADMDTRMDAVPRLTCRTTGLVIAREILSHS